MAWLTLINTKTCTTEQEFDEAFHDLVIQNSPVFAQQIGHLTSYQMNFLRALINGIHSDFGTNHIRDAYNLGSYSNITRLKKTLTENELIETTPNGIFFADPVMPHWLKKIL